MKKPEHGDGTQLPNGTEGRKLNPVKALQHALSILDILARPEYTQGVGVSELARQSGLSKTAVYNIITTFELNRFVVQDPKTSRYRLGWRLHELGQVVASGIDLVRIAQPYLDALARRTGETILLGIINGDEVAYLDYRESQQTVRFTVTPGMRRPFHATATGKALLAYQPETYIEGIIARGLPTYAPATIGDGDALRRDLATTRARGYALGLREYEPDNCSLAAPIRGHTHAIEAALCIAGPAPRVEARLQDFIPFLLEASAAVSHELGSDI